MFSGDAQARLLSGVGFTAALLVGPCGLTLVVMQADGTARAETLKRSLTPRLAPRLARMLLPLQMTASDLRGWSVTWLRLGCSDRHDEISANASGELRSAWPFDRSTWPVLSRRGHGIVEELNRVIHTPMKKEITTIANLAGFDANVIEPRRSFEPMPDGCYVAVITHSEKKKTKSRTGQLLQLTFQITYGPFIKRLRWRWLNIENTNLTAKQNARSELAEICGAGESIPMTVLVPGGRLRKVLLPAATRSDHKTAGPATARP
jgi:hypothetical protein